MFIRKLSVVAPVILVLSASLHVSQVRADPETTVSVSAQAESVCDFSFIATPDGQVSTPGGARRQNRGNLRGQNTSNLLNLGSVKFFCNSAGEFRLIARHRNLAANEAQTRLRITGLVSQLLDTDGETDLGIVQGPKDFEAPVVLRNRLKRGPLELTLVLEPL